MLMKLTPERRECHSKETGRRSFIGQLNKIEHKALDICIVEFLLLVRFFKEFEQGKSN